MVSRKINELQLQGEQPECQRLCALTLPQWQRRALLLPSAASHPTTAMPTLSVAHGPCPFLTAPSHSPLEPTWHNVAQNGACMADAGDSTTLCAPHSATFLPTRPGSWQPCHAEHAWSHSLCHPATSSQPHPQRHRRSISSSTSTKERLVLKQHPELLAGGGSRAPPARGTRLLPPGDTGKQRGQQGGSGREEGAPAVAQASRELNMNSRAV